MGRGRGTDDYGTSDMISLSSSLLPLKAMATPLSYLQDEVDKSARRATWLKRYNSCAYYTVVLAVLPIFVLLCIGLYSSSLPYWITGSNTTSANDTPGAKMGYILHALPGAIYMALVRGTNRRNLYNRYYYHGYAVTVMAWHSTGRCPLSALHRCHCS